MNFPFFLVFQFARQRVAFPLLFIIFLLFFSDFFFLPSTLSHFQLPLFFIFPSRHLLFSYANLTPQNHPSLSRNTASSLAFPFINLSLPSRSHCLQRHAISASSLHFLISCVSVHFHMSRTKAAKIPGHTCHYVSF